MDAFIRETRALSGEDEPDVDVVEFDISPADSLLVCSDGLHGAVADDEIRGALLDTGSAPDEICRRLITMANDRAVATM